jgi:hypothetical protein
MRVLFPLLVLAAHLSHCWHASAQDRLVPESGGLNMSRDRWEDQQTVREMLYKDASLLHLARMVCLPAFEPYWMVTVVREDGEDLDAPHTYYVEYVGQERKLDSLAKKARAPLDAETAEALNKTWRRMLRRTRYPAEPRIGADGVDYHFSRFLPLIDRGRPDPLAGWEEGTIWSPDDDSPCGAIVTLGERLKAYVQARPEDRDKVRAEIRAKVATLAARIDRRAGDR